MAKQNPLGARVRALRRREGLTQTEFARRLGISTSYLNLIENNRRPLSATVLIKLAGVFEIDLQSFSSSGEDRITRDLVEAFGDPVFEDFGLTSADLRELAGNSPQLSQAVLALYRNYRQIQESASALAAQVSDRQDLMSFQRARLPTEEVTDLIQEQLNHFPQVEQAAEALWEEAMLEPEQLYSQLLKHIEGTLGITVKIARPNEMKGAIRRFNTDRRELMLSEGLPPRSQTFQLALQIGLIELREYFDRVVSDHRLTSNDSRVLCRVSLANYFAGAVMMPYQRFLEAAEEERYDIELLGNRFKTSFEQVCHRLTSLRRPGAEGVPFHFVRVDIAGNISKRFSATGIRFARFGSACSKWNVYEAFLTPERIRRQMSRMPDGTTYFCIARTLRKGRGGFLAPHPIQAIGLGCDVRYAPKLVYGDGMDLEDLDAAIPIGTSCRTCERTNCQQRALPSLHRAMQVDENVRGISFFSPGEVT
ncbi:MAG: short-chain fatty acyl-CoA regulator family protein [Myxococcota bacterium]|nr:short-chain fatty acyl-CoA regulator family protein [Myxococcota bacterium]